MSARLKCGTQTFPTECSEGILKVMLGSYTIPISIPYWDEFKVDTNTCIIHRDIFAYLENDEHKIVIRHDGSLTRYTKNNEVIGNVHIELPSTLDEIKVVTKGMYLIQGNQVLNENYILPNKSILLCGQTSYGFYEIPTKWNKEYLEALSSPFNFLPTLTFKDDGGEREIIMCDENLQPTYPLITENWNMTQEKFIQ